jgi:hypothetical protein
MYAYVCMYAYMCGHVVPMQIVHFAVTVLWLSLCMYVCMHMYVCMYVCLYVCMYVCVYVWTCRANAHCAFCCHGRVALPTYVCMYV